MVEYELEARKLLSTPTGQLNIQDRVRRWMIGATLLMPLYMLLVKGLILDGWPGWYYAFQRTVAEALLSLRLLEARLGSSVVCGQRSELGSQKSVAP